MSINVQWAGNCQFKITTQGGFRLDVDSKSKVAPCPTELLLSALGACSATDVVLILQEQGFIVESLENCVTHVLTESEPRLYKSANLQFTVKGDGLSHAVVLSAAEEAIAKHCHVCLMLQPSIDISCSVQVI